MLKSLTDRQKEIIAAERQRHNERTCIYCLERGGEKETYRFGNLCYYHEDCEGKE